MSEDIEADRQLPLRMWSTPIRMTEQQWTVIKAMADEKRISMQKLLISIMSSHMRLHGIEWHDTPDLRRGPRKTLIRGKQS